jgi:predicted nucleic acid-binding protein
LIFDASSAYILIKNKDFQGLKDSRTLDLAFYEIGNSIIQENRMKIIDKKAAFVLLEVLENLAEIITMTNFQDLDARTVFEIAQKSRLTFYDASYLALAQNSKESLVTDDSSLATAAQKFGIRVYSAGNSIK